MSFVATKCCDAVMKKVFGTSEIKLPSKMDRSKSGKRILRFSPSRMRLTRLKTAPKIKTAWSISIIRLLRIVTAKAEKHYAVNKFMMLP